MEKDLQMLMASAKGAAELLKALAHEHRLMTLCLIGEGEKTVQEIESFLNIPQSSVSQLLGKLKDKEILATRRDGKYVYYRILNKSVMELIGTLQKIFCP